MAKRFTLPFCGPLPGFFSPFFFSLFLANGATADRCVSHQRPVREKLGVEPEQLQLVFGGRVMGDEKTVGELGIKANSVIHAVLNLRGGSH